MTTAQIVLLVAALLLGSVIGVAVWRYVLENRRRLAALLAIAVVSAVAGGGIWEAFRPKGATGDSRRVATGRIAQFIADHEEVPFSLQNARGLLDACYFAAQGAKPPADVMTVPQIAGWAASERGRLGQSTDRTTRVPPMGWQASRALRDADLRARMSVDDITRRILGPSRLSLGIIFRNAGTDRIDAFSGTLLLLDRFGRLLSTQRVDAAAAVGPGARVTHSITLPYNSDISAERSLATGSLAWLWIPELIDLGPQGRVVRTEAERGGLDGGCNPRTAVPADSGRSPG